MAERQLGFDFRTPVPGTPRAPWPVAPTASAPATPTLRPPVLGTLRDFGEKIGGARKDLAGRTPTAPVPVAHPKKFTDAWPLTAAGHALDTDGLADRAYAWALREEARGMRRHYRNEEWLQHVARLHRFVGNQRMIADLDQTETGAVVRATAVANVLERVDERYWHAIRDVRVYDTRSPGIDRVSLRVAGHRRSYTDVDDPKLAEDVTALATAKGSKTITFGIYHRTGQAGY